LTGDAAAERAALPDRVLTGGPDSDRRCQAEARRLRERGARRIVARRRRSNAAPPGVLGRGRRAPRRHGHVIFGAPQGLVGSIAADAGFPSVELLERVHHYELQRLRPRQRQYAAGWMPHR